MTPHIPRVLMLMASLGAGTASTCSWFRSLPNNFDPVAPAASVCAYGAWRCNAGVPERCDTDSSLDAGASRWWASVPRRVDGTYAACERCVVDSVAHCAMPVDAGGDQ